MFGIIFGTICLIALIAVIRRERYFRRHGYPQYAHGYYGCGHGCYHHHRGHPGTPQQEPPAPPATASEGSAT